MLLFRISSRPTVSENSNKNNHENGNEIKQTIQCRIHFDVDKYFN